MKKENTVFKVLENKKINNDFFLLEIQSEKKLLPVLPGQFIQVQIPHNKTFLRRPISVFDVNMNKNTIQLLIKIVGEGTKELSKLKINCLLDIIYPLGNPFTLPEPLENKSLNNFNFLITGGGCGIAPLYFLFSFLKNYNPNIVYDITFLLGFRNKESIFLIEEFKNVKNVYYTTDDGSYGEKGTVLNHSIWKNNDIKFDKIYTCGPEPMIKSVADYAIKNNIDCEVSLENLMACGVGACLCCVRNTTGGHKCVCTEGPVFNAKDIFF